MTAEVVAMQVVGEDDDIEFPAGFRAYLLEDWPCGRDWRPKTPPAGSALTRPHFKLHERRDNGGGPPPFTNGFAGALDKWVVPTAQRAIALEFSAYEVGMVIAQLASSPNVVMRRKMRVLEFFQNRDMEALMPDWCKAENLDERTAYRYCNEAVAKVWTWLQRRRRGTGVGNPS